MAGAPKENTNAEKWDIETSIDFMNKAVELSYTKTYDFIGEIAQEQRTNKGTYTYLKEKFPELKNLYDTIKSNCETNCFRNGKKGDIVPSLAIMNLKSNHGWTDRVDNTVNANVNVKSIEPIQWVDDAED